MSRKQWLEARRKGIGGSDAAAILGLSPWKSQMDVWLDKKGLLAEKDDEDGDFLRDLGLALEPVIAKLYEKETGRKLQKLSAPGIFVHPTYPFLLGSPDRLVIGEARGVELKSENVFQDKFGEPGTDQVPEHYLVQCAHYMAITQFESWDIALLRGAEFGIYTIKRDLELEKQILERLTGWWEKHIVGDVPPDVDGSKAWSLYLAQKHPANIIEIQDADAEAATLGRQLDAGMKIQKRVEQRIEGLKNRLKAIIGDADGLRGDFGKVTWKKTKDGVSVDWEAAFRDATMHVPAEALNSFIQKHMTPRPGSRRFLYTPPKEGAKNGKQLNGSASAAQLVNSDGAEASSPARD